MTMTPGRFVWYDLMTSDTKAAESFYHSVIGWEMKDAGMPDRTYTILSAGTTMVGGLMPIPPEACAAGVKPCWTGYVGVDDVDAYAARVTAAGGSVCRAPEDIPGVGRFAVVADPHGAVFILFKGNGEGPGPELNPTRQGTIGWCELHAGDGAADFEFYSGLFGWTKAQALDMGPMGVYQIFATGAEPAGGVMTKMPDTPEPFWLYYFNVDAIDAAVARTVAGGGKIELAAHQVPTGQWIVNCTDPQGAWFAMVSTKR